MKERIREMDVGRQAVVIIHGIGEQRPMETLHALVRSLRKPGTYYSKPDRLSDSFELRRIKLRIWPKRVKDEKESAGLDEWPETDFYEYYWAHRMSGTRWGPMLAWFLQLVRRGANAQERTYVRSHHGLGRLVRDVLLLTTTGIAGAVFLGVLVSRSQDRVAAGGTLLALSWVIWVARRFFRFALSQVLAVAGDAAQYLDKVPANVAARYEILRGGVDLLQSLHAPDPSSGRYTYDRIVVLGHSLGSVIAYDLVKNYWGRVNGYLPVKDEKTLKAVEHADTLPPKGSAEGTSPFHEAQHAMWESLAPASTPLVRSAQGKGPPARWIVTDLVTMGSPLAYGALLLAKSPADFEEKLRLRELPMCPPDRSRNVRPCSFAVPLGVEVSDGGETLVLHHAAPFAITRWTNLYYCADPVGGPLSHVFGPGIRDIALAEIPRVKKPPRGWIRIIRGMRAHTTYWDKAAAESQTHLRKILLRRRWSDSS